MFTDLVKILLMVDIHTGIERLDVGARAVTLSWQQRRGLYTSGPLG